MHSLDVNFELLWLAKFSTAKVTERTRTLWIRTATVRSMHLEIVETEEEFLAVLTLICALAVVQLLRVLHYVLLPENGNAAHFAVIFSYR